MDFLWPIRFNGSGPAHARDVDEEACICSSPDLIACPGANQIVTQERDCARRQLCADRPDRRRQTGLFDEVREFAGTAAAGSNQGGARAAPGAGSATQRDFRLVLREKETRRIGTAFFKAPNPLYPFAASVKGLRILPAGWNVPCFW